MKFLLLLTLFFATVFQNFAQQTPTRDSTSRKYDKVWILSFEQGTMLGNGTDIGDQLAQSTYYNGLELHLGFVKNDHKDIYSQIYRIPSMGVGFYSATYHTRDIGKPNALYYYFNIPFSFPNHKRLSMSYIGAFGLSYKFNPYDEIQNPSNIFVGSYRNCYVNFAFQLGYRFSPKWVADISLGFKHFSNGSFKLPNYGINLVPLAIGVSYKPGASKQVSEKISIPKFIAHNQYNIAFMAGSKNYAEGDPNYLKAGLSVNWLRAFSYKYRAGLGLDIYYAAKTGQRNITESTFENSVSVAIAGSWEWMLTKNLYVPVALAAYVKRHEYNGEQTWFYERAGIRYRLNNHLFAGVTIKAHKGVADFFEWTIGYTIFKDSNTY